jgi:trehalose synthase
MLQSVDVGAQTVGNYEASAGPDAIVALRDLAAPLRGCRVLHISATPYGGGVAELLRSQIPLLRDLGIAADWKLISGDEGFFRVTKAIHNGLQGSPRGLSADDEERYLTQSARNAADLDDGYDIVVVHDAQPLALRELHDRPSGRWIWRCHVDTSEPNAAVWGFLQPFLARYDAGVFTLGGFVPPDCPLGRIEIVPPAIDPESPKNLELGIDVTRPFVTQVSRFDPWKDPLGVVAAYRLAREAFPELQLALVGSMALDDPEGWDIYREIQRAVASDDGVHVFTNLTGVSNVEVNALQRLADVVIQKSIREGFGLVVSEALWKGTPVVAGRAGGIPLQLQDGVGGFLVESVEECATRLVELLGEPERRRELGERGRARVRERFLLPRLIADELLLYASVMGGRPPVSEARIGHVGEQRDPVCGMLVDRRLARRLAFDGRDHYFCSEACEREFAADPERFLRALPILPHVRRTSRWLARIRHRHDDPPDGHADSAR